MPLSGSQRWRITITELVMSQRTLSRIHCTRRSDGRTLGREQRLQCFAIKSWSSNEKPNLCNRAAHWGKGRDTSVEKKARGLLRQMGYRLQLHVAMLPCKPDIVFPKYGRIIFVHRCFWHGHKGCHRATIPMTNRDFWKRKIEVNALRDKKITPKLRALKWKVLIR
jgi:DNA mismatch endonuclease (patch repair protein)